MVRSTDRLNMTIAVDCDIKNQNKKIHGRVLDLMEGPLVPNSPEAQRCVLEQDTKFSALFWLNPGKVTTWLKNGRLGH